MCHGIDMQMLFDEKFSRMILDVISPTSNFVE
jgi:hypothetical protein